MNPGSNHLANIRDLDHREYSLVADHKWIRQLHPKARFRFQTMHDKIEKQNFLPQKNPYCL